jgi:PAS domain S-box-containing protein
MAYFNSVRTVVVHALMAAVAATTGVYVFDYWAKQAAHAELLLVQISAELHELSSLEWQAIAMEKVDAGLEQRVSEVRVQVDKLRGAIEGSDDGVSELNTIYRNFTVALEREFGLIKSNENAEAHRFDQTVVDPLFDELHDKIDKMIIERAAAKERIGSIADVGMVLSLLSAALVVASMFAAFTASRSRQAQRLNAARELTELSSDSSWEQDEHFRFISSSAAALEIGLSPLMMGATRWQLPVDPAATDWPAHRAMLEAHQPFKNFEYKLVADGMSAQWLSTSGKPQFDGGGNFKGYRGTTRNITEQKQAEQALRCSQSELRQLAAHQECVKEDERKRIARDIHDELGQNLMVLRLDVAQMTTDPDFGAATQGRIEAALNQIDTTIKCVRAIINDLRPAVLDLGLHAAIDWQAKEFARRSGIACDVHIDHAEFPMDDQRATALFRSLQESLSNIIRHAKASQVRIDMQRNNGQLYIKIADDGIGVHPDCSGKKKAFGLIGIEERMHALGGTFSTTSEPGNGMTIMLSIPL